MKILKICYIVLISLIALTMAVMVYIDQHNYLQTPEAASQAAMDYQEKVYERYGSSGNGYAYDRGAYNDVYLSYVLRPIVWSMVTLTIIGLLGRLLWWMIDGIVGLIRKKPCHNHPSQAN